MAMTVPPTNRLTQADLASLQKCGITLEVVDAARIFRVDSLHGADIVGRAFKAGIDYAGIVFPYFLPNGDADNQHIREYRLRRDHPDHEYRPDGTIKEKGKYLGPPGRSNLLYFPSGTTSLMLRDTKLNVLVVEGEKKTLACDRFAGGSLLVTGVPGVNGWRGSNKTQGPAGEKISVSGPIQDLDELAWQARQVTVLYDRDADQNPSVAAARSGLARELRSRGAIVQIAEMPADGPDKGIDDLLGRVEFQMGFESAKTELKKILDGAAIDGLGEFVAYAPDCTFIHTTDSQAYIAKSLNSRFPKVAGLAPSQFLLTTNAVNARSWAPAEPQIIEDKMLLEGGWQKKVGYRIYNEYRSPAIRLGDPEDAVPWLAHIERIYPDDCEHIVRFMAHRVQKPAEKLNHALCLGGGPGIGKDTALEPLIDAIGRSNWEEIGPHKLFENFNDYLRSVVLRISETKDMGDGRRSDLYERLKTITTAPPDAVRINRKHLAEFKIPNLCAVIATTNHTNGLYLPPDDRRFYVAWSDSQREEFPDGYFTDLYRWLNEGGGREAAAGYLHALDLSEFDAKAPPPKTIAWQRMVDAGRSTEDADMANALEALGWPDALTLDNLRRVADESFACFLGDRKNLRTVGYRFEAADYIRVPNPGHSQKGLWKIRGRYQTVYAKRQLTENERLSAVRGLI
jgi:hypothetical protein